MEIETLVRRLTSEFNGESIHDERIYLLGKDFFSFELGDKSLLLLMAIVKSVKKACEKNTVILGGSHCKRAFVSELIKSCPFIDYVFYNEIWSKPNYNDVVTLLYQINTSQRTKPTPSLLNCFYRSGDGLVEDLNPGVLEIHTGKYINPFPRYEFIDVNYSYNVAEVCGDAFVAQHGTSQRNVWKTVEGITTLKFTHGCVNSCAYCKGSKIPAQFEPVVAVVDYLEWVVKERGFRHFFFLNRELNLTTKYFRRFCRELINRKLDIRWSDSFEFNNLTSDDIQLMKDAGCIQACIGIDTTSHEVGRRMARSVVPGQMEKILACLNANGIWTRANIIVGFPYQTFTEIEEDCRFLTENRDLIDHLNVSEFKLFPRTLCGDRPAEYGLHIIDEELRVQRLLQQDNPNITYFSHAFEEIGGRTWQEMSQFAREAFERVISTRDVTLDSVAAKIPLIFLMYDTFSGDKNAVRAFVSAYADYLKGCHKLRVDVLGAEASSKLSIGGASPVDNRL